MKKIRLLITGFIFLLVLCGCARISEEFARGKQRTICPSPPS